MQLFDDDFADSFDFDVLDATKIIPEELVPVTPIGRMVLDRMVDNFFAETEQVAFCTQNVVPGHRLHQRSAAAGPQLLLPRHAAQAPRRPELHAHPGQRPEVPGGPLPAGRPHGHHQPGRAHQLRAELGHRGHARTREDPAGGFTTFPAVEQGAKQRVRSERFADHYSQARQFLISQTADRADPHRESVRVRAVQGRRPRHPDPDGGQPPQRRRRPSPRRLLTDSAFPSSPPPPLRLKRQSPTSRPHPR